MENPAEDPFKNETPERIAQHYSAAMDSVKLILGGKPSYVPEVVWKQTVQRNKDHLEIMLKRPFWTNEDLTPFRRALEA